MDQRGCVLDAVPHRQRPLTAAEALGHREFVLTRLYESA